MSDTDRPKCASHQVGYRHCPLWARWRVLNRGAWVPVCGLHHRALTARDVESEAL